MSLLKTSVLPLITALLLSAAGVAHAAIPVLIPGLATVASERSCLAGQERELCANVRLDLETTGQDWLDLKLMEKLSLEPGDAALAAAENGEQGLVALRKQARRWLEQRRPELQEALDNDYFTGFEEHGQLRFLGQRGKLASFSATSYSYSGGAHGLGITRYLLMDLQNRNWLQLKDILLSDQQDALLDMLIAAYQEQHPELARDWLAKTRAEQAGQLLVDNFLFNEYGLLFSYGPYELGPYAAGQISLQLHSHQLRALIPEGFMPASLSIGE